ncbi:hypothetical protein I4U23_029027 [Adineta vaga]|nr:hypothetical protein I4U23_029027 [Adineta vaga]
MGWTHKFIILIFLQLLVIPDINGNANRRRRRRQTSGSLFGTNSNLGASAPAGYNYPASTNIKGIRMNNPDARDLLGNPIMSASNTDNTLNSMNLYNQPRPQQQQIYGTNDQSLLNPTYSGNNFYSTGNTNQVLRDQNGNPLSSGTLGSSFYSSGSNTQMAYPPNSNQVLTNKDLYGTLPNTNTNNNNQYGYNSNLLPNSNTYGGPMGSNSNLIPNSNTYTGQINSNNNLPPNSNTYSGQMGSNSNLVPNSNAYSGQMGSNANLVPNSNTYSGVMGTNSNPNYWSNTNNNNNNNRYNQNSANSWYPNRDTGYSSNNNNNNNYANQNPYANYYNHSYRLESSCLMIFLTIFIIRMFH